MPNARAHTLFNRLKAIKFDTTNRFLEAAAILSELEAEGKWQDLGYDSWHSFVGDPELDLSTGYVSTAINIHRKFIVEFGVNPEEIAEIGWGKVAMILPVVTRENLEELMEQAKGNSKSDLSKTIKQLKTPNDSKHKHVWRYYRKCAECGEVEYVDETDL